MQKALIISKSSFKLIVIIYADNEAKALQKCKKIKGNSWWPNAVLINFKEDRESCLVPLFTGYTRKQSFTIF